jgi:streptogramin lyase
MNVARILICPALAVTAIMAVAGDPLERQGVVKPALPRHVLIIRHAEKPDDPADIHLTRRGEERAQALPQLFVASPERPDPFPTPDFLFATRPTDKSVRPIETLTPLSMKLKLPIDRGYRNFLPADADVDKKVDRKGVVELADEIIGNKKYAGKTVLICWHHGTIPDLAGRLRATGYPKKWKDAVFDRVWQISYDERGAATFADRPQQLPGDSPKKIKIARIETVAGTGAPGYAGDGGIATKAKLDQPFHCEVDPRGFVYVAESGNHCVRKIDLATGIISTVAGTGAKGYTGDGALATRATFNEPYAVVATAAGDLFIADRLNAVVRKVDGKSGIVTTVAGTGKKGYAGDGGPGSAALLVEPNDVCLDGKGGLLIADVGDWRVRRLDLTTGVMTTFAGIGRPAKAGKGFARDQVGDGGPATKAVIVGARAVCVNSNGNVYICEREGSTIRKVDGQGVITTIAGTGAWGAAGDGGPALKAEFKGPKGIRADAAGNLYVVDTENHAIRKIAAKSGTVTTVAGGRKGTGGDGGAATEAGLDRPHGCAVDAQGNLWIADSENHRVRKVSPGN